MKTTSCQKCGAITTEATLVPVYGYDWDNPNEDEQGSISVIVGYECQDKAACKERRVQNGRALRGIADDTYCRGTGQGWGQQQ